MVICTGKISWHIENDLNPCKHNIFGLEMINNRVAGKREFVRNLYCILIISFDIQRKSMQIKSSLIVKIEFGNILTVLLFPHGKNSLNTSTVSLRKVERGRSPFAKKCRNVNLMMWALKWDCTKAIKLQVSILKGYTIHKYLE